MLAYWALWGLFYFPYKEFIVAVEYSMDYYIPRRKSGIYWIQVCRAAAAVEISLWTR